MKGEGVAYAASQDGFIGLALDIYADPDGGETGGFLTRDKALLEFRFRELSRFGLENEVPMSVMEFGTIRETIEDPDKGGTQWIADMLDIFDQYEVSYALWNYHGPAMGLYLSAYGSEPAMPNRALINVVRDHHATTSTVTAPASTSER